jgi:GNAT superfamily N-acetyltransferase
MLEIKANDLTSEVFLSLYTSVGWEPPCEAQVRVALQNSLATFTALDDGKLVGMARLIGDGGMSFYIKDFAVLPSHQGKGIGARLIRALEGYIRDTVVPGWAVSLELISTNEAVPFYNRMGFKERPCEWDGPGMMKMLR